MNAADQLARFDAWFASHPSPASPRTYDPRDNLDAETLRRSRITSVPASMTYRRAADMPREPWRDELAVATGDYREEWS